VKRLVASGHSQQGDKKPSVNILDFYYSSGLLASMKANFNTECQKLGYALFCGPCPLHPQEKNDRLIFNIYAPRKGFFWTCAKEPTVYTDSFPGLTDEEIQEIQDIKVTKNEIQKTRVEIISRHMVTQKTFISIKNQDKYAFFVYSPEKGKYELTGKDVMKVEIQRIHSELFGDELLSNIVTENIMNSIASLTDRGSDTKVFENDDGIVYFIPFKDRDVMVNRKTGETKIMEKDPVERPFLSALPYSVGEVRNSDMPKELRELLDLVPASHRDELLLEIASPLAFHGSRRIFVNFSRVGSTGKTTVLRRIEELYPDLAVWVEPDTLGERFEKSAFLGKSAVLMDEYEGGGLAIRRQLKTIASGNTLRAEVKNGPILQIRNRLSIVVNTNNLQFDYRDDALMSRLIIIPFIRNFKENREVEPWSEEVRKKIIIYLIKNVVSKYFLKNPRMYPVAKMKKWAEDSMSGEKPEDGVEDFLMSYVYRGFEKSGVIVTLDEAFKYYLMYTGKNEIIPLTEQEFKERIVTLSLRDKAWLVDGKLSIRKKGLELFME